MIQLSCQLCFVQFSCLSRVILRNLDVLHFLTFSPFIVALKLSLFNCPLLLKNHFHSFVYIYLEFNCSFVHPCLLCLFVVTICCILVLDSFYSFALHSHHHCVTINFFMSMNSSPRSVTSISLILLVREQIAVVFHFHDYMSLMCPH